MTSNPNAAPIGPNLDSPYVVPSPAPAWTLQRCVVCDGKGHVWGGMTTTPDKCSFCDGRKAVLVSAWGTVKKISE